VAALGGQRVFLRRRFSDWNLLRLSQTLRRSILKIFITFAGQCDRDFLVIATEIMSRAGDSSRFLSATAPESMRLQEGRKMSEL